MSFTFAFNILHFYGKQYIINKWGKDFYQKYKRLAEIKMADLEKELPPKIHKKFDFNYKFVCVYVSIYCSLEKMNITVSEIEMTIWKMNEYFFRAIPKALFKMVKPNKRAFEDSKKYQKLGEDGLLNKNEWIMSICEESDGSIHTKFSQCGAYNVLTKLGYGFIFPCVCRLDYLTANIAGIRFERNKTIGDGDQFCENHIFGFGYTEWSPEKGFKNRK